MSRMPVLCVRVCVRCTCMHACIGMEPNIGSIGKHWAYDSGFSLRVVLNALGAVRLSRSQWPVEWVQQKQE